jgi:hypothetical protein
MPQHTRIPTQKTNAFPCKGMLPSQIVSNGMEKGTGNLEHNLHLNALK